MQGNPLAAVPWLAHYSGAYDIVFQSDQVILPSSYVEAVSIATPGHLSCGFEGGGATDHNIG